MSSSPITPGARSNLWDSRYIVCPHILQLFGSSKSQQSSDSLESHLTHSKCQVVILGILFLSSISTAIQNTLVHPIECTPLWICHSHFRWRRFRQRTIQRPRSYRQGRRKPTHITRATLNWW